MSDMRKTKIICTLGPAVDDEDMIRKLILAGMNAARFNFSHGTHESHLAQLQKLRHVRDELGLPVAAILDTKGPEIRIKTFQDGRIELQKGDTFTLTTADCEGGTDKVSVTYLNLHKEVAPGNHILVDDGLIDLLVEKIDGQEIVCTVENGGPLSNNKSINIPDVHILLPSLTEKDKEDLKFAVEQDFDFIAASFVRKAGDVEDIRAYLNECGGQNIRIISKIENREGVDNLDAIIDVSDGTSCVMLAGETAGGKYPIEAVEAMASTVSAAEDAIDYWGRFRERTYITGATTINDAITHTCCMTAMDLDAKAILAPTQSGYTAKVISRFRPACPIIAVCQNEKVRRQLSISWGVHSYLTGFVDSTDRLFSMSVDVARKEGVANVGDTVVITAGVPIGKSGTTNLIKAQVVGEGF